MEIGQNREDQGRKRLSVWACVSLAMVGFVVCSAVYGMIAHAGLVAVCGADYPTSGNLFFIVMESSMLLAVLTSTLVMLYFERRPFSDMGLVLKGHIKDIGAGILVAIVLYMLGFGLSVALGVVEVTGFQFDPVSLAESWLFFLLVALTEEIMMRGYVLGRLLHTPLNKFLSLFISAVLFALLHIFNPNIAFLPMLNLVLAGLLLGVSYLYTRNLCFPIALHLFWNWIQGPILGYQVSGNKFGNSLLTLHFPEDNVLNGGAFGFEGSLICTILMVVFTIAIVWWGEKREAINLVGPRSY